MNVTGKQAIAAARDNPGRKYPGAGAPRCKAGMRVPVPRPGLRIDTVAAGDAPAGAPADASADGARA